MIYIFCANGVEEVEALATLDVLRRAGLDVKTVGIPDKTVTGSNRITFHTDLSINEFEKAAPKTAEAVILPGGMPGTETLANNKTVCEFVKLIAKQGGLLCAICAAPSVLGRLGLLKGKKATCYPGFENMLDGATVLPDKVVTDGKTITAKGMGCAVDFGLAIVSVLKDEKTAENLAKRIMLK